MSNKIVDTRKYNKDKRARLGRFGDTKIRKVDGKPSHVNALEAALIDTDRKSGEKFAKDVGSGTINPYTGLKEYSQFSDWLANEYGIGESSDDRRRAAEEKERQRKSDIRAGMKGEDWSAAGDFSGEVFGALMDFGVTGKEMDKYLTGFESEPYEFIEADYTTTQAGLDIQQDKYGMQEGQLMQNKAFGMQDLQGQYGSSLGQARAQSLGASRKANMAFSGTIESGLQDQMRKLSKGLDTGISRLESSYDRGMQDIGLGREQLELDRTSATTAYDKAMYGEGQRQMDRLWSELGALEQTREG